MSGELLQAVGPPLIHAVVHTLAAGAVALEPAMLQFDPRATRIFDNEPHLDFAGMGRIRVVLEAVVEMPRQDDPSRRFEGGDPPGVALLAIGTHLVPAATNLGLKDEVAIPASLIEYSLGHQVPNSAVNTSNARCCDTATVIVLRTVPMSTC